MHAGAGGWAGASAPPPPRASLSLPLSTSLMLRPPAPPPLLAFISLIFYRHDSTHAPSPLLSHAFHPSFSASLSRDHRRPSSLEMAGMPALGGRAAFTAGRSSAQKRM